MKKVTSSKTSTKAKSPKTPKVKNTSTSNVNVNSTPVNSPITSTASKSNISIKKLGALWLWIKKHWILLVALLVMLFGGLGVGLFFLLSGPSQSIETPFTFDEIDGFYGYEVNDLVGNIYWDTPEDYNGKITYTIKDNIINNGQKYVDIKNETYVIAPGLGIGEYDFTICGLASKNGKYKKTSMVLPVHFQIYPAEPTGQVVKFSEWSFIPHANYQGEPEIKLSISRDGRYVGGQIEYWVTNEEHFKIEGNILKLKPGLSVGAYYTTVKAKLKNPAPGYEDGEFSESERIMIGVDVTIFDLGNILVKDINTNDEVGTYVSYPAKQVTLKKIKSNGSNATTELSTKNIGGDSSHPDYGWDIDIPNFKLDTSNNRLPPDTPFDINYSIDSVTCEYMGDNNPDPLPADLESNFTINASALNIVDSDTLRTLTPFTSNDTFNRSIKYDIKIKANIINNPNYWGEVISTFSIIIVDSTYMPGFIDTSGSSFQQGACEPGYKNWYGVEFNNGPMGSELQGGSSGGYFNSPFTKQYLGLIFDGDLNDNNRNNTAQINGLQESDFIDINTGTTIGTGSSSINGNPPGNGDVNANILNTRFDGKYINFWTQNGRFGSWHGNSSISVMPSYSYTGIYSGTNINNNLQNIPSATPYYLANYRFYMHIERDMSADGTESYPFARVPYQWDIVGANDDNQNGEIDLDEYNILITDVSCDVPLSGWYNFNVNWNNVPSAKRKPYVRYGFRVTHTQMRAAKGIVKYPAGYPTASDNDAANYANGGVIDQPDSPYSFFNVPKKSSTYNRQSLCVGQVNKYINMGDIQVFGTDKPFF